MVAFLFLPREEITEPPSTTEASNCTFKLKSEQSELCFQNNSKAKAIKRTDGAQEIAHH